MNETLARCATPHAVLFLLTAYLEHAHRQAGAASLPEALLALPLGGESDVGARRAAARALLMRCVGETGEAGPLVRELDGVLEAAHARLLALACRPEPALTARACPASSPGP